MGQNLKGKFGTFVEEIEYCAITMYSPMFKINF